MLIIGWCGNLIALHLSANRRVEYVSYKFDYEIYNVQITVIFERPVNEFFNILVNFDVLYGIYFSESLQASSDITFPKAESDVLINFAYYSLTSLNYFF